MNRIKINNTLNRLGIKHEIETMAMALPLTYKTKYDMNEIKFTELSQKFVLIKGKRKNGIENLIYQASYIADQAGMKYILVFNQLRQEEIKYMIQWHIPFITYDGSLFLPFLTLYVEGPNLPEQINLKVFNPSQQLIMTYLLSLKDDDEISIEQIQQATELSQPTVYRGIKLFTQLNWVEKVEQTLEVASANEVFENAQHYFFNPIKKTIYMEKEVFNNLHKHDFFLAGEYALAHETMLAMNTSAEQYAISQKKFNEQLSQLGIKNQPYSTIKSPNSVEIQLWDYQPYHVAVGTIQHENQPVVDTLSLYLTLKDEEDPRVQKELESMLKAYLGKGERDVGKL